MAEIPSGGRQMVSYADLYEDSPVPEPYQYRRRKKKAKGGSAGGGGNRCQDLDNPLKQEGGSGEQSSQLVGSQGQQKKNMKGSGKRQNVNSDAHGEKHQHHQQKKQKLNNNEQQQQQQQQQPILPPIPPFFPGMDPRLLLQFQQQQSPFQGQQQQQMMNTENISQTANIPFPPIGLPLPFPPLPPILPETMDPTTLQNQLAAAAALLPFAYSFPQVFPTGSMPPSSFTPSNPMPTPPNRNQQQKQRQQNQNQHQKKKPINNNSQQQQPQNQRRNFKTINCQFYLQNKCKKGDECTYIHDPSLLPPPPPPKPTPQPPRRPICKYAIAGACNKGSECEFDHDLSSIACRFFWLGRACKNLETCGYFHGVGSKPLNEEVTPENANTETATTTETTPTDSSSVERKHPSFKNLTTPIPEFLSPLLDSMILDFMKWTIYDTQWEEWCKRNMDSNKCEAWLEFVKGWKEKNKVLVNRALKIQEVRPDRKKRAQVEYEIFKVGSTDVEGGWGAVLFQDFEDVDVVEEAEESTDVVAKQDVIPENAEEIKLDGVEL